MPSKNSESTKSISLTKMSGMAATRSDSCTSAGRDWVTFAHGERQPFIYVEMRSPSSSTSAMEVIHTDTNTTLVRGLYLQGATGSRSLTESESCSSTLKCTSAMEVIHTDTKPCVLSKQRLGHQFADNTVLLPIP